jgi:hypothetical protein
MPVTILLCGSADHAGYQIEQVRDATEFLTTHFSCREAQRAHEIDERESATAAAGLGAWRIKRSPLAL